MILIEHKVEVLAENTLYPIYTEDVRKVFADNDLSGIQDYLNRNLGPDVTIKQIAPASLSEVLHYEKKRGECTTPCPHREGSIKVGSAKCKECVFREKGDSDSQMIICGWNKYTEH